MRISSVAIGIKILEGCCFYCDQLSGALFCYYYRADVQMHFYSMIDEQLRWKNQDDVFVELRVHDS